MNYRSDHDVCRSHRAYPNRHAARLAKRAWTRILRRQGEWSITQCLSVFKCRTVPDHESHYHIGRRKRPEHRGDQAA